MRIWIVDRLIAFLKWKDDWRPSLAARRDRRRAAIKLHREAGEPFWTDADRHVGRPGSREVQDLGPDWFGEAASHRVVDD